MAVRLGEGSGMLRYWYWVSGSRYEVASDCVITDNQAGLRGGGVYVGPGKVAVVSGIPRNRGYAPESNEAEVVKNTAGLEPHDLLDNVLCATAFQHGFGAE